MKTLQEALCTFIVIPWKKNWIQLILFMSNFTYEIIRTYSEIYRKLSFGWEHFYFRFENSLTRMLLLKEPPFILNIILLNFTHKLSILFTRTMEVN